MKGLICALSSSGTAFSVRLAGCLVIGGRIASATGLESEGGRDKKNKNQDPFLPLALTGTPNTITN